MSEPTSVFTFDPLDPGEPAGRPAAFAELRERSPVHRTEDGLWVLSRFDDVATVLAAPERFSSRPNPYVPVSDGPREELDALGMERLLAIAAHLPVDLAELTEARTIAAADPPQHTRMRRIVSRGFTPARVQKMNETIGSIVERCLPEGDALDGFDLVSQLAVPLPVEMIASILGLEDLDLATVKRWSDVFASAVGDASQTPEAQIAMLETLNEFATFFVPLVESRRTTPQDDVVSAMVQAVENDSLTTVETLMMAITMMVAGNETTTNLIGNMVVELLADRDQLALLLERPELLAGAVEEANRFTAPIQMTFREVLEDTEVGGSLLPKGAVVACHLAAANRDPRQFEQPDRFMVDRPRDRHLSFGFGIHFCLGSHLAGQEVRTAVGTLLPHLAGLRLADEPLVKNPSAILNGWRRIVLERL